MNKDTTIHSGSHLKKIISKGSWYFVASVITKALAIIMWPITTRYLSPNDIGVLDSLDSIRLLLPFFISLCLDEAYYRFYFNHNKTFDELKKYISTYFWIIISWGIVVLLIGTLIGRIYLTKLFDVPFYPFILITSSCRSLCACPVSWNSFLVALFRIHSTLFNLLSISTSRSSSRISRP